MTARAQNESYINAEFAQAKREEQTISPNPPSGSKWKIHETLHSKTNIGVGGHKSPANFFSLPYSKKEPF